MVDADLDGVFDVAIVGCGPVGALAATLSAQAGLRTVVVDRAAGIYDLPRAIHFDAQIMRLFQQIGIADELRSLVRPWYRSVFTGADGEVLRVHDFPTEEVEGWPPHVLFYQPELERLLRAAAVASGATLKLATELTGVTQSAEMVRLSLSHGEGSTSTVAARWAVGCDGASSSVRKALGVELDDMRFDEPWLVVDAVVADQAGLPRESRMVCDPRRPATLIEGRGLHRRWELMLLPGDDPAEIATESCVRSLIAEWIDPDAVDIIRAAVYRFHGLVAHEWRDRRVFLAGDAAHQTPPFLGQGMCHGLRDVSNLMWKLCEVAAGRSGPDLLDSYVAERKPHVEEIITMAVAAGRDICIIDPVAAAERDLRLRERARHNTLPPSPFLGMPPLRDGVFGPGDGAGRLFPQPSVVIAGEGERRLDDVVGSRFALMVLADERSDPPSAGCDTSAFEQRSIIVVAVGESADVVVGPVGARLVVDGEAIVRRWMESVGCRVALVRPDRYVYATANSVGEMVDALEGFDVALERTSAYTSSESCA